MAQKSISEETLKTDCGVNIRSIFPLMSQKKRNVWAYNISKDFLSKLDYREWRAVKNKVNSVL